MYFWRIEELKTRMAACPLSEREVLPYLVVYAALSSAVLGFPQTDFNVWDGLGAAWSTLLAVVGTIYVYRQNGGAGGQHFLQRYFAIGWVVAVRVLVTFLLVTIVVVIPLQVMRVEMDVLDRLEFVGMAVVEVVMYWRIGYHVNDLAQRTMGT